MISINSRVCSALGYYKVVAEPFAQCGQLMCKVQADCENTIKIRGTEIVTMPLDSLVLAD